MHRTLLLPLVQKYEAWEYVPKHEQFRVCWAYMEEQGTLGEVFDDPESDKLLEILGDPWPDWSGMTGAMARAKAGSLFQDLIIRGAPTMSQEFINVRAEMREAGEFIA